MIAVSKTTALDLQKLYDVPSQKITTIYNGYASVGRPSDETIKSFGLKSYKYFLYIGTLQPRKNIPTLIQAFALYHKTHPDIKLVIVGRKGWMYDSIFEEVKRLNIEDSVVFTGYVKSLKMFYTNAIAYILPSLYEGFGLPVIEAMHYECPVIVSDTPALMEVSDGACLSFPAHDTIALAQALEKISQLSVRKALIAKGTKRAKHFSWDKTAKQTLDIIKPVSYTHLDVYKRQPLHVGVLRCMLQLKALSSLLVGKLIGSTYLTETYSKAYEVSKKTR